MFERAVQAFAVFSMSLLKVKKLRKNAILPARQSKQAAGFDLAACLDEDLTLASGKRIAVPTGLALEIAPGYEGQVRPRSGLALKHGVTVLNAPGTIDADYRGEVQVLLINHGEEHVVFKHGDRIAQLLLAPVSTPTVQEVAMLSATSRGGGGFGSTGN